MVPNFNQFLLTHYCERTVRPHGIFDNAALGRVRCELKAVSVMTLNLGLNLLHNVFVHYFNPSHFQ